MQLHWTHLSIAVLLTACGPRQANDGGDDDSPVGPADWSPCVSRNDVPDVTCAELCAAEGLTCVANGCAVESEFCDPEPCDMATQALAIDGEALCADASNGRFAAAECDAPIQWALSTTLRCCCAED